MFYTNMNISIKHNLLIYFLRKRGKGGIGDYHLQLWGVLSKIPNPKQNSPGQDRTNQGVQSTIICGEKNVIELSYSSSSWATSYLCLMSFHSLPLFTSWKMASAVQSRPRSKKSAPTKNYGVVIQVSHKNVLVDGKKVVV